MKGYMFIFFVRFIMELRSLIICWFREKIVNQSCDAWKPTQILFSVLLVSTTDLQASEINSFTPTRLSNVSRYSIETRSISKRMSLTSANSAVSYKFAQTMASSIHTNCVFITIFGLWAVRRLPWLKWKHKTKLANKISEPWLFDSNY